MGVLGVQGHTWCWCPARGGHPVPVASRTWRRWHQLVLLEGKEDTWLRGFKCLPVGSTLFLIENSLKNPLQAVRPPLSSKPGQVWRQGGAQHGKGPGTAW